MNARSVVRWTTPLTLAVVGEKPNPSWRTWAVPVTARPSRLAVKVNVTVVFAGRLKAEYSTRAMPRLSVVALEAVRLPSVSGSEDTLTVTPNRGAPLSVTIANTPVVWLAGRSNQSESPSTTYTGAGPGAGGVEKTRTAETDATTAMAITIAATVSSFFRSIHGPPGSSGPSEGGSSFGASGSAPFRGLRARRIRIPTTAAAATPIPPALARTRTFDGPGATTRVNSADWTVDPFRSSAVNRYVCEPAAKVSAARNTAPVSFAPPTYWSGIEAPSSTTSTAGASPSGSRYRTWNRKTVRSSPCAGSTEDSRRTGARFWGGGGGDRTTSYSSTNGAEVAKPSNAVARIVTFCSFVTVNEVPD